MFTIEIGSHISLKIITIYNAFGSNQTAFLEKFFLLDLLTGVENHIIFRGDFNIYFTDFSQLRQLFIDLIGSYNLLIAFDVPMRISFSCIYAFNPNLFQNYSSSSWVVDHNLADHSSQILDLHKWLLFHH